MNIAYIITGLGLGGAEIVTIDIANNMVQNNNHVILLYLTGDNAHTHRIDPRVKVIELNMPKTFLGFIRVIFKTRKLLKKFRPDILHGQMFHANIFARVLRLIYSIPLICTEHNKNIEGIVRMKIYRYTNWLSCFNTNVSQEAIDYFIEHKAFSQKNSKAVYNGIDLSRFVFSPDARQVIRNQRGISESDFLFINVGRLTAAKDQQNLLEALSLLPKGKLIILGEGELRPKLEEFVIHKALFSRVIFAGAHKNIEDFYSAADCFVLSSAWEGFGLVIAEAMACSLPVITTDAGGCKEVIDNPQFVVPCGNSTILASKMKKIQNMLPEERKNLGAENREKAKRFDLNGVCAEWRHIYQNIIKKNKS